MLVLKNMLFNTNIKIAGNIVTLKTYQSNQLYNYVAKRYQTGFEKKISAEDIEREKIKRFLKSCRRAKARIFDLVACNVGKHLDYNGNKQTVKFLTLTFKKNITGIEDANAEITKFFKRLSYQAYGINKNVIKYISVPELQKRGVWHYHIILFNMKYIPYKSYKNKNGETIKGLLDIWGQGGLWINALKKNLDETTVAKYITKYISKGINVKEGEEYTSINKEEENEGEKRLSDYFIYKKHGMENKKRYQCSRGLYKPYIAKAQINPQQQATIYSFIVEKTKEKEKIYLNEMENEYRGTINILSSELGQADIKAIKEYILEIFLDNREKFKTEYKIDWGKIRNKIFNKKWKKGGKICRQIK